MTDQTSSSTTGSTPAPRQPRRGSAPQTTPQQAGKGKHSGVDTTPVSMELADIIADAEDFLKARRSFDETEAAIDADAQALAEHVEALRVSLAKREQNIQARRAANAKARTDHAIDNNVLVADTTSQLPQLEAPKSNVSKIDKLAAADAWLRDPSNKETDPRHGLAQSGFDIADDAKLREELGMTPDAPWEHETVKSAVRQQIVAHYRDDQPEDQPSDDNKSETTRSRTVLHGVKQWSKNQRDKHSDNRRTI